MELLLTPPTPPVDFSTSATSQAAAPATAGPHWSWWIFLAGVLACSCIGPTCALN